MKKLIVVASLAVLAACTSTQQDTPQVNFSPMAMTSQTTMVDNLTLSLDSKDIRSAQYIALVDNGRNNTYPVHTKQNVRIALETALLQQFRSQGYKVAVNSPNSVMLEVQELIIDVTNGMMTNEMRASIRLQITAENSDGKLVKTFVGSANNSSTFSATEFQIEEMLNRITNLVLIDIAKDAELNNYMKERF